MAKVLGIGGVFFKSPDPARLRAWYSQRLGFAADEYGAMFAPATMPQGGMPSGIHLPPRPIISFRHSVFMINVVVHRSRRLEPDRGGTIVVIYAENRSFDHLYGLFPGANGIANATPEQYTQVDHDGKPLSQLPPVWKGKVADPAFPKDCRTSRSGIDAPPINLPLSVATRDLIHKFYPQQEQINGGRNDSLRRGFGRRRAGDGLLRRLEAADVEVGAGIHAGRQFLHGGLRRFVPQPLLADLRVHAGRPEGAREPSRPARRARMAQAPAGFAGLRAHRTGGVRAVRLHARRLRDQHEPAAVPAVARAAGEGWRSAPRRSGQALPAAADDEDHRRHAVRERRHVGVVRRRVGCGGQGRHAASGREASGHLQQRAWARRTSSRITSRSTISRASRPARRTASAISRITPTWSRASTRASLPQVAFYKPQGHAQRASGLHRRAVGRQHIAELVAKIKASPLWASTAIIVTYDENGGFWDHVAPPTGDRWGPGHADSGDRDLAVREARLCRPHALRHDVDPQIHHAALRLEPLPGVRPQMGDLTAAFDF